MIYVFVAAGFITLALTHVLVNHFTRLSLAKIRGPKSSSFILGNLLDLFQRPVGQTDFEWQNTYGNIVRFKTVFGGDQLLVADPKALQRIFHTTAYLYSKQPHLRVQSRMLNGKGIVWADGEDHKRHRKVLLPGFGGPESKAFSNVFKGCAESMCMKWMETIGNNIDQKADLNVQAWLSRATLDAIGQAAFDVQFGTIHNDEHSLAKTYNNMLNDISGRPSVPQLFIQAASKYIPMPILEWVTDHGSNYRLQRAREVKVAATKVARELVREKAQLLLAGKGKRDVFTLLVKANMDTEARNKLTEEELLSQMRTILLAGHETTSNTLSWILLELARHPEIQCRLRAEIQETEAAIQARGDMQFTTADLDGMPYMAAVVKEGLRYHPVVPHIHRIAGGDDILPLAYPITAESGEVFNEIFVPKGTRIVVSIPAYNRNKELWGEDAHEFNPDRWLNGVASEKKSVLIGAYANLMTFTSGTRSCLGWRFAVIEIQAFLVEMIGKFEFAMTDRAGRICRGPGIVMVPMVEGEFERGAQLPLAVSIASREQGART